MTISLAAVFIPVLFMGGIIGRLFHEFAVTIGCAILVSGFVSLSLTPMLCSRFLKAAEGQEKHGPRLPGSERGFDGMLRLYERTLKPVIARREDPRVLRPRSRRDGMALREDPEGLSPDGGPGARLWIHRGRAGNRFSGDEGAPAAGRRDRASGPGCRQPALELRTARQRQRRQLRHRARAVEAPVGAQGAPPTRSFRTCGRSSPQIPGIRTFLQVPPPIRLGGISDEEPVSVHAAGLRHGRALPVSRRCSNRRCGACPASRT